MPPPNRPAPDDDPGFEVVGDSRPPAAKPLPPKAPTAKPLPPKAPAAPPAKPLPPKAPASAPAAKALPPAPPPKKPAVTVVDDDEDDVPKKKSKARIVEDDEDDAPKKKSKARIVDDDEDEARPKKKKSKARVVDDEDDTVEGRVIDDDDDTVEDDAPRKKKKKKKKGGAQISDANRSFMEEWGGPLFLMLLGVVMLCVGTWGQYKGPDAQVSAFVVVIVRLIYEIITIPVSIIMLMLIGSVMGIEYGTLTSAVRGLATIGLLMSGMDAVLDWLGLAMFIARPIVFVVSLGMMMTFFKLDANEAVITIIGMNLLSFAFTLLFFFLLAVIILGSMKKDDFRNGGGDGDEEVPQFNEDGGFDPGNGDDEDRPRRRNRNRNNQPPVNNNFDGAEMGLRLPPVHVAPTITLAANATRPARVPRSGWPEARPPIVFDAVCSA